LTVDPLGRGDQLTLSYTYAEQLNQWQAGYALPLGATGITWNTGYTGLTYELGKDLSDLKARGWAEIITTGVSYPFVRTRNKSIWGGISAEYMMLRDEASGEKTRDRKLANGVGYLSGNFFDTFAGGGLTNASLVVTGGNVDLSGYSPNNDADDTGPRTYGGFVRANYFLARLQRITGPFALFGSIRGQFTPDNLDSSQKFILGGPSGVRAYPVGEAPADEGHALTLETRIDVPGLPLATQLIGFFDTGWVKLHHSPWPGSITNASGRNEYFLSGAGIGVNTVKPGIFNIRAFYAHTLGSNPGRSTSGNNADGLSDKGRFWLQFIVWI
jgi:hemolysin activation/secretion protein